MTQLEECKKAIEQICMRQNDCWHDTKTIATAVYVILTHMIDADRKTENSSDFPNNCETCKFELYCPEMCEGCCEWDSHYEPKVEPQTERSE